MTKKRINLEKIFSEKNSEVEIPLDSLSILTKGKEKSLPIRLLSLETLNEYKTRIQDIESMKAEKEESELDPLYQESMIELVAESLDVGPNDVRENIPLAILTEFVTKIIDVNSDLSKLKDMEGDESFQESVAVVEDKN